MSNDGLIIENMDLSHIHLAVALMLAIFQVLVVKINDHISHQIFAVF